MSSRASETPKVPHSWQNNVQNVSQKNQNPDITKKLWLYLWKSPGGGKELFKSSQSIILLSLNTTYTRIPFLRQVNQMYLPLINQQMARRQITKALCNVGRRGCIASVAARGWGIEEESWVPKWSQDDPAMIPQTDPNLIQSYTKIMLKLSQRYPNMILKLS